jgi:hypothetical protein
VLATWFVLIVYAVWFGVSLLTQRYALRLRGWICRFDIFRVLPTWQLFRSPPLHTALAWRDQFHDHTIGTWQEVSMMPQATWLAPLWNPQAFCPHLLYTFALEVAGAAQAASRGTHTVETGFAYRALWHYIMHLPRAPETTARQFAVLVPDDDDSATPSRAVYISAFHPLPSSSVERPRQLQT